MKRADDDAAAPGRSTPRPVGVTPLNAVLMVLTNAPDAGVAEAIAQALVSERLAACVNLLAPCRSVYRWQEAIEQTEEFPLLIKTTTARYAALQARLLELHPYEVPELLAWRPDAALPVYADWVLAQTRGRVGRD